MTRRTLVRSTGRWLSASAALAAASYAACVGYSWLRYGHAAPARSLDEDDPLLDRLMPIYEVVERHHILVAAPAEITLEAARQLDLQRSLVARSIFRAREWAMGARPTVEPPRGDFIAQMQHIGWSVLAEVPGREIVMGAATQPWLADVVFRPLPAEEFVTFREPDHVKIAWTLRADPVGSTRSVFRTETRVATTDAGAREKFRRYWAFVAPGIILIRRLLLGPLKADAERLAGERHA